MPKRNNLGNAVQGLACLAILWFIMFGDPSRLPTQWLTAIPGGFLLSGPWFLICMSMLYFIEGTRAADTGDEILDTIVMTKRIAWKKEGVHIVCIADGRLLSFMDSMDRAAVFGNLLDNAVEAVMRLQREERLINLSVGEKADFFLISCENRSAGRASFSNGLPLTG